MSTNGSYNGYANYQTWNVCLWIANDERFYDFAGLCGSYAEFKNMLRDRFEDLSIPGGRIGRFETPDGVAWSDSAVNLEELQEYWEENFSKVPA
jgi:hypothetical protein